MIGSKEVMINGVTFDRTGKVAVGYAEDGHCAAVRVFLIHYFPAGGVMMHRAETLRQNIIHASRTYFHVEVRDAVELD
jgi:hypothetical protein